MSRFLTLVLVAATSALAGQVRVDLPGGSGGGDDRSVLQYDNGTPSWLTWAGTYRGTWFNTQDFMPGSEGFELHQMEYWFYQSSNTDPWDTAQFYSEIWNGDDLGPVTLLTQGIVTAVHYSPVFHTFSPYQEVAQNFWGIVNTEMSSGGWPSILADGVYKGLPDHSYFSDDFIVWEPWSGDPVYGDFFIRAHGTFIMGSLDPTTWGSVKALY